MDDNKTSPSEAALLVYATCNFNISILYRVRQLMSVHFASEIDLVITEGLDGKKVVNVIPQKMISSSPLVTLRLCRLLVEWTVWTTPLAIIPS